MKAYLKSLFLLLLATACASLMAQDPNQYAIGIPPVKFSVGDADAARQVEDLIYEYFVNSKRITIVERGFFKDLENEKWLQSSEDFIDTETIEKTKSKGAKQLLIARITSCQVERVDGTSGKKSYHCNLNVGVRLIDVETSEVIVSDSWTNGDHAIWNPKSFITSTSESGAIQKAVKELKKPVKQFMDDNYPVQAGIVSVETTAGTKAKTIMIELGSEDGIKKNDKLVVYETGTRKVRGKDMSYKTEIGQIKIAEINGPSLATAEVKKGGDVILAKYNQGAKILIKSN